MSRKLKDIDIEEISLCDSAANRKKFYILKRSNKMDDELKKLLEDWFDEDEVSEYDEEVKVLKGDDEVLMKKVKDAAMKAIKGAVNILNKYKADLPDDALKALKTLAKYASYGYGYPEKKEASDADVKKAGAKLSKGTIEKIEKIITELGELIGKEINKSKDGNISDEVQAKLDELAGYKDKEKKAIEKAEAEAEKKEKEEKEKLEKRIEALEKEKGIKKSIEGPEKDADDEDGEDPFPSIPIIR